MTANATSDRRAAGWIGYDWFKLIVAIILILLLLWLSWGANPAAPALTAPALTAPAAGAQLPAGMVTFAGTGTPGSQVQVVVDGTPVGTATVGADGSWSLDADVSNPGQHAVTVTALGANGQPAAGVGPAEANFTVAEAAAAQPLVDAPRMTEPAQGAQLPAGTVTFAGTGTPGSQVQVAVDGAPVGVATVGADGSWSLDADITNPGQRSVVILPVGANGQPIPGVMPGVSSFTVAEAAAGGTGSGTTAGSGATNGNTAGTGSTSGSGTNSGTSGGGVALPQVLPAILSLNPGDAIQAGKQAIGGRGTPGKQVEVLNGDQVLGTATVGADGTWSFEWDATPGAYDLSVREEGINGNGPVVAITVSDAAAAGGVGTGTSAGTAGGSGAAGGTGAATGGSTGGTAGGTAGGTSANAPSTLPNTSGEKHHVFLLLLAMLLFMGSGIVRVARR
jgi:large repetitive protein